MLRIRVLPGLHRPDLAVVYADENRLRVPYALYSQIANGNRFVVQVRGVTKSGTVAIRGKDFNVREADNRSSGPLQQRFQPGGHLSIAVHRDQVDAIERL